MNNPRGYAYDVFISYRRVAKVERWIDRIFLQQFQDHLELELGYKPRIFVDRRELTEGDVWKSQLASAIQTSACMVAVLSKPYFNSKACVAEWESFKQRAEISNLHQNGVGLIVPIRWHDGETFPAAVREITEIDFRAYAITADFFWQSQLAMDFERALTPLCEKLATRIAGAPAYRDDWPVVEPSDVEIEMPADSRWQYKLKKVK